MRIIYLTIIILLAISCKNDKSTTTAQKTNPSGLQSIPTEEYRLLYDSCTAVDYIFHTLPFSVSQSDQASVRNNLNLFTIESIDMSIDQCESLGREFFQINGEVRYEADIYFSRECQFIVWIKDGKPAYANKLSNTGRDFYGKLVSQALNLGKTNG